MCLAKGENPAHSGELLAKGLVVLGQLLGEDLVVKLLVGGRLREAVEEDNGL